MVKVAHGQGILDRGQVAIDGVEFLQHKFRRARGGIKIRVQLLELPVVGRVALQRRPGAEIEIVEQGVGLFVAQDVHRLLPHQHLDAAQGVHLAQALELRARRGRISADAGQRLGVLHEPAVECIGRPDDDRRGIRPNSRQAQGGAGGKQHALGPAEGGLVLQQHRVAAHDEQADEEMGEHVSVGAHKAVLPIEERGGRGDERGGGRPRPVRGADEAQGIVAGDSEGRAEPQAEHEAGFVQPHGLDVTAADAQGISEVRGQVGEGLAQGGPAAEEGRGECPADQAGRGVAPAPQLPGEHTGDRKTGQQQVGEFHQRQEAEAEGREPGQPAVGQDPVPRQRQAVEQDQDHVDGVHVADPEGEKINIVDGPAPAGETAAEAPDGKGKGQVDPELPGQLGAVEPAGIGRGKDETEGAVGKHEVAAELPAVFERITQRHAPGRVEIRGGREREPDQHEPQARNQGAVAQDAAQPGAGLAGRCGGKDWFRIGHGGRRGHQLETMRSGRPESLRGWFRAVSPSKSSRASRARSACFGRTRSMS